MAVFAIIAPGAPAQAVSEFTPPGCEFAVVFPATPSVANVSTNVSRPMTLARLTVRDFKIEASCTTGYPVGALAQLTDDQLSGFVEGLAERIGIEEPRFTVSYNGSARQIDVSGHTPHVEGGLPVRAQIRYGRSSRLMLQITAPTSATSTQTLEALLSDLLGTQ